MDEERKSSQKGYICVQVPCKAGEAYPYLTKTHVGQNHAFVNFVTPT